MIALALSMLLAAQDEVSRNGVRIASPSIPVVALGGRKIRAGTPVDIEIVDTIDSRTARIGDHFRIRLATPIIVDESIAVPAGATGVGEVIQASHPRFMTGRPGELIVAARYLDVDGVRLELRGFRINKAGQQFLAFAPTAGVTVITQNITIPSGTTAVAKVAADIVVPSPATGQ